MKRYLIITAVLLPTFAAAFRRRKPEQWAP
jgi:hypothetical protein